MSGPSGTDALRPAKAELRRRMTAVLSSIGADERLAAGRRVAEAMRGQPGYADARLVLAFLSMPAELDTGPAIDAALADGKRVAVPRIDGDDIAFVELSTGWKAWPRDRWGIPTPPTGAAALPFAEIAVGPTLALIPGLAFDAAGGRLGRGKGYYDRFLEGVYAAAEAGARRFTALGLGYGAQLVDAVPRGPLDRLVDGLILV